MSIIFKDALLKPLTEVQFIAATAAYYYLTPSDKLNL